MSDVKGDVLDHETVDVWNDPNDPKIENPAVLDLGAPPAQDILRRKTMMVAATLAAVTLLASGVYAIARRPDRSLNEINGLPKQSNAGAAQPPPWTRVVRAATTPARSAGPEDDVPPEVANTRPMMRAEVTPEDEEEAARVARDTAGYEPQPRYAANVAPRAKVRAADDGDQEADLPNQKERGSSEHREFGGEREMPALGGASPPPSGSPGSTQLAAIAQALQANAVGQDDQREAFMSRPGIGSGRGRTQRIGPCSVRAGSPVHGNMLVATNSDVPSGNTVTLTVNENVRCGGKFQHLAIPQGSTFVGEVNSKPAYGATRLQLCMKQLDRTPSVGNPDGDSTPFGCLVVADIRGAPGMVADVDNHWDKLIMGSLLSAVLSMGAGASMGNQEGFAPTVGQNAARAAGQSFSRAGDAIVQRELRVPPTLTTKQLEGVTVLFTENVDVPPWLEPTD